MLKVNAKEELVRFLDFFCLKFEGIECTRKDGTIVNTTKLEELDFEYDNEDKDDLNGIVYCTYRHLNGYIAPCWLTRKKYIGKYWEWDTNHVPSFYYDNNIKLFEQSMNHQNKLEEMNDNVNFDIANDEGKKVLQTISPQLEDKIKVSSSITERVKTFEDACHEVGINPTQYMSKYKDETADVIAYMKLKVICKALNEGWSPAFIEGENYFQPSFSLFTEEELSEGIDNGFIKMFDTIGIPNSVGDYNVFVFTDSIRFTSNGLTSNFLNSLCLKNRELADYCGRQFINLWSDINIAK